MYRVWVCHGLHVYRRGHNSTLRNTRKKILDIPAILDKAFRWATIFGRHLIIPKMLVYIGSSKLPPGSPYLSTIIPPRELCPRCNPLLNPVRRKKAASLTATMSMLWYKYPLGELAWTWTSRYSWGRRGTRVVRWCQKAVIGIYRVHLGVLPWILIAFRIPNNHSAGLTSTIQDIQECQWNPETCILDCHKDWLAFASK